MSKSWIQHPETHELIPRDEYVRPSKVTSAFVQGDIESFVSPIDQTVISDRKHYREHCERHGVVPAQEFSTEWLTKRRKELEGETTSKAASLERKRTMYEKWVSLENG
jgi:hypothetical protein